LLLVVVKRSTGSGSIGDSWNGYSATDCMPVIRFIHHHISKDNYSCSNKEHNPTVAKIELISSGRPTDYARDLQLRSSRAAVLQVLDVLDANRATSC